MWQPRVIVNPAIPYLIVGPGGYQPKKEAATTKFEP
jgi:hypothetical protein